MPSPSAFRSAFGFATHRDGEFRGLHYEYAKFRHKCVRRNERYEFPCEISFLNVSVSKVEKALLHLPQNLVVKSAFGSPYKCSLKITSVCAKDAKDSIVIAKGNGIAIRMRNENKKEEKEKAQPIVKLDGYQTRRSHFNTSHCAKCGKSIEIGEVIAKKNGDTKRGGWMHIECVKNKKKEKEIKK